MKYKVVSDAVVRRLPKYRRHLQDLKNDKVDRISSTEFAGKMNLTASQIRQDLNHFGGFGQQGYGYSVDHLYDEVSNILGMNKKYSVVMVGCGRLGEAIANFLKNYEPNFEIKAICDIRPDFKGKEVVGVKIMNREEFDSYLDEIQVDIGILTVPPEQLPDVVEVFKAHNVKGIWNFGLTDLDIKGVAVSNVHLSDSLQSLVYYINHPE